MKTIMLALAATSMLAVPAAANHNNAGGNGGKVGQQAKVCLVTFDPDVTTTEGSDVIKAQYVPLSIAIKLKNRDMSDRQLILTYGTSGAPTGGGVDFGRIDAGALDNAPDSFNMMTSTETACEFLADYADSRDMDEDDD